MNTRLLRKVAKHIAEEPKRFIMGNVCQEKGSDQTKVRETEQVAGKDEWAFPRCGTAACISGWACLLSDNRDPDWNDGRDLLGISTSQADLLFGLWNWPKKFHESFLKGKTPQVRAKVAVARIEHFIKTKGAE